MIQQQRQDLVRADKRPVRIHDRKPVRAALAHDGCDNEITTTVVATLPDPFAQHDLDRALAALPAQLLERAGAATTTQRIRGNGVAVAVRAGPGPGVVQVAAVCAGGR